MPRPPPRPGRWRAARFRAGSRAPRMRKARAVAGRVDRPGRRCARRVDARCRSRPRARRPRPGAVSGATPMPTSTRSAAIRAAVGEHGAGQTASVAEQPRRAPSPSRSVDAVAPVQRRGNSPRSPAPRPARGCAPPPRPASPRSPVVDQHRRRLEPDVAAADHQRPRAGRETRGQRVGVAEAAHHQHAVEVAAERRRQAARRRRRWSAPAGRRAGRARPTSDTARAARSIARGADAGQQRDALGGVEARRAADTAARARARPSGTPWTAAGAGRAASGSAPTSVSGPAWPSARSFATSAAPAWPAPTTTMRACFGSIVRASVHWPFSAPLRLYGGAARPQPCERAEPHDDLRPATGCPTATLHRE